MTTSNLMSLPIDIPWRRLATSRDMMDQNYGDRSYPSKWKSSVAVFYYESPPEEQRFEDRIVTFIKVACSITGLQLDLEEFKLQEQYQDLIIRQHLAEKRKQQVEMEPSMLLRDWEEKIFENYRDKVIPYHPCYGALLQVAVFPKGEEGQQFPLEQYPIIFDFEPKKREMYESATEAKQSLSQSRSAINIKKETKSVESSESGFSLGTMFGLVPGTTQGGPAANITGNFSSKTGTSTETVDMTTTDYSREKRENYSYTTNLTHMYHLLNSYHLGTNRAMFMLQPRPHIIDSEYTFVNGPRRLEGIQEFFLVVERPSNVSGLCVEAALETAHIQMSTGWKAIVIPKGELRKDGNAEKTAEALGLSAKERDDFLEILVKGDKRASKGDDQTSPDRLGDITMPWVIDELLRDHLGLVSNRINFAWSWNGMDPGIRATIKQRIQKGIRLEENVQSEFIYKWLVCSHILGENPALDPLEAAEVIYERVQNCTGTLFLTGRVVSACYGHLIATMKGVTDSVVYESAMDSLPDMDNPLAKNITRAEAANRITERIGQQMIESISSPSRFPYGELSLLEASFIQGAFLDAMAAMPDDDPYNVTLEQIEGLDPELKTRLADVFGVKRRKDALVLEPYQLRTALGLSEAEIRKLRSQLIGKGPIRPVKPGEVPVIVPNVEGMSLEAARQLIARNMLSVGEDIVYQVAIEPRDTVLNQFPNAGTVMQRGQTVNLVVSSGPVVIPDVIGLSAEEATAKLEELSLRVVRTSAVTDQQPEGHVVETTPAAGTEVPRNSQVVLLIAKSAETGRHKQP